MAEEIKSELSDEVIELIKLLGRKPKLVTIYDPENEGARKYTEIKEKKAGELGIQFEKFEILNPFASRVKFLINDQITKFNNDKNIDGVMIQLPLIDRETDGELCKLIDPKKDVDGLNPSAGSGQVVMPATVRAVIEILNNAPRPPLNLRGGDIVVIGNKGVVGSRLMKELGCQGMDKEDFDPSTLLRADVIISATGVPGLIKSEMVKDGVICIDVGFPKGDFDPSIALRAAFFTPVPGGVGPVTVAMLFRNLVELAKMGGQESAPRF